MVVSKNTTRTDTLVADLSGLLERNKKASALYEGKVLGEVFDRKEIMQALVMYIQERDHEIRIHTQNRLKDGFTLEAIRTDRLANAIFYKDKISKIFEDEVNTYKPLVSKKWWQLWR